MLHLNTIDGAVHSLLLELSSATYLSDFALAGGTSLALQIGHRKSIDLDFFAFNEVNMSEIALQLENSFSNITIRSTTPAFIFCTINGVKCDFVKHVKYKFINPLVNFEGIKMYSKEDVAAMKLNAICGRGSKKDFYDIYSLLQEYPLKQLLQFYDYKFQSDNSWMALRSLQYFEDAESQELPELIKEFPAWRVIKEFLTETVNQFTFDAS